MNAVRRFRPSVIIPALLAAVLVVSLGAAPASAQAPLIIKMATLVPENSSWFLVLKDVADKWGKASGGRIKVIMYPGGRKGDDPDVVRDMRLGGLQGAVLTSVGLAEIDRTIYALSIPMAFDSYDEVYAVLDKMRPRVEAAMAEKGFVVVNWADGGWVHFFSKEPVATPDDLKKLKLFSWAGDPKSIEIWKSLGFNPRPAPSTELVTGLQTGLFEAFGAPPQVCAIARYFEHAKYMTDMKWALLLAATVIEKRTWDKIPADLKPTLLQIARDGGARLQADIRRSGESDVQAMKKAGLTVVPVDAKTKDLWRKMAESTYPQLRGDYVPADAFDESLRLRDEYRKTHQAAAPVKKKRHMVGSALKRTEQGVLVAAIGLACVLPLIDMIGRPLGGFHIPGKDVYVSHLTLWLAFVGGLAATSQSKHLTLSTTEFFEDGLVRRLSHVFAFSVAAAVVAILAYASWNVVMATRGGEDKVLPIGLPEWIKFLVMPTALALSALVFAWKASDYWTGRLTALAAIPVAFSIGLLPPAAAAHVWPLALVILAAALLGAPVFVAMGGIALVLFFREGVPVAQVSSEVYRLIASPTLPAIPLLTAAGYVLAESTAAERLVRFFRAIFGWMPGGIAVMVAAVCALFTTFTGGSGVTIIALGGLVYPILRKDGYSEGFSLGLVTASGSLGLLFPPSLPVILYSVVASTRDQPVPADQLFLAGLLPGLLLVVITAAYGIVIGRRVATRRQPFSLREVAAASWHAKWELMLPVVIVALFVTGFATMLETAAAALAYAVIVECFITRDIHVFRQLPEVLLKAAALMGAVLILLSVAMGLTSYLVDAQIPDMLLGWVKTHIHSQVMFLLALNVLLLVLGSVLEIYSAIIILAPIIAPMGAAFGVDPLHLGVIFLANLELGFLFPPVGLNLFLSSSRFNKPLTSLYRHVVPFLIITGIGVLLIMYTDSMSLGVLRLLGMR